MQVLSTQGGRGGQYADLRVESGRHLLTTSLRHCKCGNYNEVLFKAFVSYHTSSFSYIELSKLIMSLIPVHYCYNQHHLVMS